MTIHLTDAQAQSLRQDNTSPLSVIDPQTNALWYLVSASDYETVREILEDERKQKAIRKVGIRNAGARLGEE